MSPRTQIDPDCLEEVRSHAQRVFPQECCGALLGRDREDGCREIQRALPAANLSVEPRYGFELEPAVLLTAERLARAAGLVVTGIYHSHPRGMAVPSERDRATAIPDMSYLLIAPPGGHVRSFRCGPGGDFIEEDLIPWNPIRP